jgi:hypothetical protein
METLAIKIAFLLENKIVAFPPGVVGDFLTHMAVKIANEVFGIIGCLRQGAYIASFHQARSLVEICAAVNFVFYEQTRTEQRVWMFFEYEKLSGYNFFSQLQKDYENGKVPQEEYEGMRALADELAVTTDAVKERWSEIYGIPVNKLHKVKNWHHGLTITDMIEKMKDHRIKVRLYRSLSKNTHSNPFAKNMTDGEHLVIGIPRDATKIMHLKNAVQVFSYEFFRLIDQNLGTTHVSDHLHDLIAAIR